MIALGMPSAGLVHTPTCAAFTAMAVNIAATFSAPLLITPEGRVEQNRNMCAEISIQQKCKWLLFIDSDMIFPYDTFSRLVAHDVDIVGCNAAGRVSGKPVFPYVGDGLIEVPSIGMAVTLIKTSVFIGMDRPWFYVPPRDAGVAGEDVTFCHNARDAGFSVFCDLELSKEIGHLSIIDRRL